MEAQPMMAVGGSWMAYQDREGRPCWHNTATNEWTYNITGVPHVQPPAQMVNYGYPAMAAAAPVAPAPAAAAPGHPYTPPGALQNADRDALLVLYRSTYGTNWILQTNWNTDVHLGLWYGVEVNTEGRVVKLKLHLNGLRGHIPPELGALSELQELRLGANELTASIPKELGDLTKLEYLSLSDNRLTGNIPPELGKLRALTELGLRSNELTGPIPSELGNLGALTLLNFHGNQLSGSIPPELGKLAALLGLGLANNQLTGHIPPELRALSELRMLWLNSNKLTGFIPPELGNLMELKELRLSNNQLTGFLPPELGNLVELKELTLSENKLTGPIPPELGNLAALQRLDLDHNRLSGGPMARESLDSWRARLQEQFPAEPDVGTEEEVNVQRSSSTQGGEPAGSDAAPAGGTSSPKEEDAERSLRVQVASFGELKKLTGENREALEGIRQLIGTPTAGSSSPRTEFANEDKLRELDRLIAMAKVLDEMTLQHMGDKVLQRKELALPPGSKAYYITVRTGLGNAYLAASVVASSLVDTSKTGGMGMAGEALKVLSSAVPVVGGLVGFTAAALKAGDRHIQTRRVVKITEIAMDANECCSLAKTLALRLVDGLAAGTILKACKTEETLLPAMAVPDVGGGGCGWNQAVGALPDDASEEIVLEWFSGEMANALGNIDGRSGSSAEQAGRKLGKRHLQKLLVAVGRGCLEGTDTAEEKIERLLKVIAPEASGRPASTPSAPEISFVRSPVPAPSHGGGLDQGAELAAMKAQLEALLVADKRRQATEVRQQAEIAALQSDNKKLQSENKKLLGEVDAVKKRIPKPQGGPSGWVDAGGGQVFAQKQEIKTKEDSFEGVDSTAAVAAADHHPVNHAQLREFAAFQDERHREHDDRHREHDANHSRLQRELERKNKRGGRR